MKGCVPLVSVIVPVYNVADFLQECVDSLLCQTYKNIEIILIDDGSTDGSGEMCDHLTSVDHRINTIHKSNGGLSSARNAGIENARGEYIAFVDSDDVVHEQYVGRMLELLLNADADISITGFVEGNVVNRSAMGLSSSTNLMTDGLSALEMILYQNKLIPSAWAKLYKADIFKKIRFKENIFYEDIEFNARALPVTGKAVYSDDRLYFYRQRPTSILGEFNMKRLDVLDVTREIHERLMNTPLEPAARDRRLSAAFNMFILLCRHGKHDSKEADMCWDLINKLRHGELTNKRVRLKNKIGVMLSYLGRNAVKTVGKIVS